MENVQNWYARTTSLRSGFCFLKRCAVTWSVTLFVTVLALRAQDFQGIFKG